MAAYDSASVLDKALRLMGDDLTPVDLNQAFSLLGQIESPRGIWAFNINRTPQQKWFLRRLRLDGQVAGEPARRRPRRAQLSFLASLAAQPRTGYRAGRPRTRTGRTVPARGRTPARPGRRSGRRAAAARPLRGRRSQRLHHDVPGEQPDRVDVAQLLDGAGRPRASASRRLARVYRRWWPMARSKRDIADGNAGTMSTTAPPGRTSAPIARSAPDVVRDVLEHVERDGRAVSRRYAGGVAGLVARASGRRAAIDGMPGEAVSQSVRRRDSVGLGGGEPVHVRQPIPARSRRCPEPISMGCSPRYGRASAASQRRYRAASERSSRTVGL